MGNTYLDSIAAFSDPSENREMKYLDSLGDWSVPESSKPSIGGGGTVGSGDLPDKVLDQLVRYGSDIGAANIYLSDDYSRLHITPEYESFPKIPSDTLILYRSNLAMVSSSGTYPSIYVSPFVLNKNSSSPGNSLFQEGSTDSTILNNFKKSLRTVTSSSPLVLAPSGGNYFKAGQFLYAIEGPVDMSETTFWWTPHDSSSTYNFYPDFDDLVTWSLNIYSPDASLLPEIYVITTPSDSYKITLSNTFNNISGGINGIMKKFHISTGTIIIEESSSSIKADDVDLTNVDYRYLIVKRNQKNYYIPFSATFDENEHQDLPMDIRRRGYFDLSTSSRTFDSYVGVNDPDFTKEGFYVGRYPTCAYSGFNNKVTVKNLTGFNDWNLTRHGLVSGYSNQYLNNDNEEKFYRCDNIDGFNRWNVYAGRVAHNSPTAGGDSFPGIEALVTRGSTETFSSSGSIHNMDGVNIFNDWTFYGDENAEGTPAKNSAIGFSIHNIIGGNTVTDFQGFNNWKLKKGSTVGLASLFCRQYNYVEPDLVKYGQGKEYHDYTNIFQNWTFEDSVYLYWFYIFNNFGLKDTEFFRTWGPFTSTMRVKFESLFLMNHQYGYPIDLSGLGSLKFPEGITLEFTNMFNPYYNNYNYSFNKSTDAEWDFSQLDPWGDQPGFDPESEGTKAMFGSKAYISSDIKKPSWWCPNNGGWEAVPS